MNRYLVTGGAGFIGSHVVDALVARGARVRVVDNLSTGKRGNLVQCDGNVELIEADVSAAGVADAAVRGVDCVVHMAAIPAVPWSIDDLLATNRANVDGTLRMFKAARDAAVTRFVFASSAAVYGDVQVLPTHEDVPPRPISPYALQKLAGEHYARSFHALYGLDVVALRIFNVFGPRQYHGSPYSGVISRFTAALCERRPPTIHGDGGQTRDFTYVSDVVDGIIAACHAPAVGGQAINLARGGRTSLKRLFDVLRDLVGADVEPDYGPLRKGDIRHSQADPSRARRLLGCAAGVTLEEGLCRTVSWHRSSR